MAQILKMDKILQSQQSQAIEHKQYIMDSKFNSRPLIVISILLPSLLMGWKMGKGKFLGPVAKQLTEVGLLTLASHFQRQLKDIFKK